MKVAFRESFLRDVRAIKEKSVQRRGLKIEADTVIFVRVLNRKDIYKYFP